MAGFFSIRNFVAKQLIKPDAEGIMKLPNKGNIDFGEMMIRENLFKRGIDVNSVTSEKQLESILNTPLVEPKVVPKKSGEVIKVDFGGFPPEKKAGGGRTGLSYLLAEDSNQRVPFKLGGIDKMRRAFLKAIGAGAATAGAAKTGLFGLLKGGSKQAAKDLTQVPIGDPPGMPPWFKPLVNRVIREGEDVTKRFATKEREIVHQISVEGKIGKDAIGVDDIRVTQDLDTGNVRVQYNTTKSPGESGVDLNYKASEEIPLKGGKGSVRTTDEFSAVEAEPRYTGGPEDADIEWDGENIVSEVKDLMSDTSALKQFATGKPLSKKELAIAKQKQNQLKSLNESNVEQAEYLETKYGPGPDPSDLVDDYAFGGRVPFVGGGWAFKLAKKYRQSKEYKKFIEKLFLKTSTDIRRGEGAFKNLSLDKKIQLHDDLTKEATNYQKTGELPESAHQYFGFNPEQQYADRLLQKQLKMTPEEELRQEFPGITDDLLNQILTDTNQQRIAEVKATMREALTMQEKGMGTEEIIQVIQKTPRTKNALGGLANMLGE